MTDEDRPAWLLWQIRALWRAVTELTNRIEALERQPRDAPED